LLLIIIALLLAAPFLQHTIKRSKASGWIVIPAASFRETYHQFYPLIDSLEKKDYELHSFATGFKKIDTTVSTNNDTTSNNYWRLLTQLSDTLAQAIPVDLFTPNNLSYFDGIKPKTNLNIHWHTYTPVDSVKNWIGGAWLTTGGNIRVAQGIATPKSISYQYDDLKNGQSGSDYDMTIDNGVPVIGLKKTSSKKIKVDTTTQRIAIYADKNKVDADYLKAALFAIADLTKQKTIIRQFSSVELIPARQDWLFWLTEKPMDNEIVHKTKKTYLLMSAVKAAIFLRG